MLCQFSPAANQLSILFSSVSKRDGGTTELKKNNVVCQGTKFLLKKANTCKVFFSSNQNVTENNE